MDGRPNPSPERLRRVGPARRVALAGAAAVLVAATVLAWPGRLVTGEVATFEALNDLPWGIGLPLAVVMSAGSSVGAAVIVVGALVAGRRSAAAVLALAWLLARVLSTVLKAAVDRGRPPDLLPDVVLRQHLPSDGGFPSAHAAIAVALAVAIGWAWPRARLPAVAVAGMVVLARPYVGVHLPLDMVGGTALGVLCGVAAVVAGETVIRRRDLAAAPRPPGERD